MAEDKIGVWLSLTMSLQVNSKRHEKLIKELLMAFAV